MFQAGGKKKQVQKSTGEREQRIWGTAPLASGFRVRKRTATNEAEQASRHTGSQRVLRVRTEGLCCQRTTQ